jgi:hypothetical protein
MTTTSRARTVLLVIAAATLAAAPAMADQVVFQPRPLVELSGPETPQDFPLHLVLDDGTAEGDVGVGSTTARQFLWFNQFDMPVPELTLEEVWVLFPDGANVTAGGAIDLVVYHDPDGNPGNGATRVATWPATVQVADGATFSIYEVPSQLRLDGGGDVLVGVINRFTESGVSPPTLPAAIDTTSSQQRSWIAVWSGDPPDPPLLPADQTFSLVDDFQPGNWMIRAFGTPVLDNPVPAMGWPGVAALIVLLAAAGALVARRL